MDFYKRTIAVVTLPSACFTKIGVLHAGDGTVELGEAIDAVTQRAQAEVNKSFEKLLEQQACSVVLSSSGGHPVQKKPSFGLQMVGFLACFPGATRCFMDFKQSKLRIYFARETLQLHEVPAQDLWKQTHTHY